MNILANKIFSQELCKTCGKNPAMPSLLRLRGNYRCSPCYRSAQKKTRSNKVRSGYSPVCSRHPDRLANKKFYVKDGKTRCSECMYNPGLRRRLVIRHARIRDVILNYKKSHSCVDCGEPDWRCLDFDHRENKKFQLSQGRSYTLENVLQEIDKCDIRCANCHRKRHIKDR